MIDASNLQPIERSDMQKPTEIAKTFVDPASGIGTLRIDFPPVNTFSGDGGVPQSIIVSLLSLNRDPDVRAIAIYSAGRLFSAGADISEFRGDPDQDTGPLRALFAAMDDISKPIVIAMHGVAFGGGLEVALCAHYRIAETKTRIGLPEVTLGILPGGGGTQRLPRLVPMADAIDLVTTGKTITPSKAKDIGLIDAIFDGAPREAAIAFAQKLIAEKAPIRRTRDLEIAPFDSGLFVQAEKALDRVVPTNPGPLRALDCLREAAKGPFDRALAYEYDAFNKLMDDPQSQGIRHAFLGERAAVKIPGFEGQKSGRPVNSAGIVGAGTMGIGIALACLKAGIPTVLLDQNQEALDRALVNIQGQLDGQVNKGRMTQAKADAQLGALTLSTRYDAITQADIVIEAVFEDLGVKKAVFHKIDAAAKPGAVLASNTSTLDVNVIAGFTNRPRDVVGTHFFSPANIMRLLEVIRADATDPTTLLATAEFARKIGKVGVVVGVCDGFVGNRIMEEYLRQAYFLLEEGASPEQLDHALESWGWAMGICRVMDLAGQDIGWAIRKRRAVDQPDRPYSGFPDLICEQGWFG